MSYGNLKPYIIVSYIRSDILFKQIANVVLSRTPILTGG